MDGNHGMDCVFGILCHLADQEKTLSAHEDVCISTDRIRCSREILVISS